MADKQLEFGKPVELNDDWLEKHKGHSLIWIKHTVFKGLDGTEYQECRCYTCGKIARIAVRSVTTRPERKPPKETRKKERKPNFMDFGHTSPSINENAEGLRYSGWM
jgi:hypothetical protein